MSWRALVWWHPPAILKHVLVNLTDGNAVSGVLWTSRGPWLVIRNASFIEKDASPVAIDGEVVVERPRVLFIQVLP